MTPTTNKQNLISYLLKNGRNESWNDLARIFKLTSGEVARHTWREFKKRRETTKSPLTQPINTLTDQKKRVLEKIAEYVAGRDPFRTPGQINSISSSYVYKRTSKDKLVEIDIFDAHIGKLAWDKETGEDYDIDIAVARYRAAINEFISRIDFSNVDKILLPTGNDLVNVDNKMNTTTAGTPQSSDSRFGKMFQATKALIIDVVDELVKLAPVDIVIIPGNHDEATLFTLGEVLSAYYHTNSQVSVDNEPILRKYYEYGANMIMFTHGDKEKISDLGMIAATEQAEMWGRTRYREVHLGHFHRAKGLQSMFVDEYPGFKIRILPSISGTDAWHHSKGFISAKGAKAFIWDKSKGLITEHSYNI